MLNKPNDLTKFKNKNLTLANASGETKIRHRNGINLTFAKMPTPAKRVLFLMMAQYDSRKPFGDDLVFKITADDYAELCDIDKSTAYAQLKQASIMMQQQVLEVPKDQLLPIIPRGFEDIEKSLNISERKQVRMFNITQWVDYSYDSGYIEISPSRQMEPYIAAISTDFTTQALLSAVRFSDKNTANMYQFIRESMSNKSTANFIDITIDQLKEKLGMYKLVYNKKVYSYPEYPIFKRDVINKTLKSINKQTELNIKPVLVVEKNGRKAHILRFTYSLESEEIQEELF